VAAQLAERSGAALGALSTLEREVRAMVRGEAGSLRLASFATANARIVPHRAGRRGRRPTNAEVQLDEGEPDEVLDGVLDGALDAAVVFDYDRDPRDWPVELRRAQLLAEPFALAVAPEHRLAGSTGTPRWTSTGRPRRPGSVPGRTLRRAVAGSAGRRGGFTPAHRVPQQRLRAWSGSWLPATSGWPCAALAWRNRGEHLAG